MMILVSPEAKVFLRCLEALDMRQQKFVLKLTSRRIKSKALFLGG